MLLSCWHARNIMHAQPMIACSFCLLGLQDDMIMSHAAGERRKEPTEQAEQAHGKRSRYKGFAGSDPRRRSFLAT